MAKLILSVDGQVLKEHTLAKERTLIGRKPHNDIQIDNLAVSGEHAAIITILNDSFVEDLGSTNGTMVNGKPIKKHFLQNNDVIEIGKHRLKYFNDQQAAAAGGAADFEKTMIIRSPSKAPPAPAPAPAAAAAPAPAATASASAAPADRSMGDTHNNLKAAEHLRPPEMPKPAPAPAPAPSPAPAAAAPTPPPAPRPAPAAAPAEAGAAGGLREAAIQVLSGAAAGRTLDLTKNLTTIGKPGLQVAVITKRPNGYFITHVEGATYPTLNGASLGAQAHALGDHDLIEIAGVKMEFFYKP
jgi:predicted component of type VI protein secretion system